MTAPFLPVMLGSDDNAYGVARSFHEGYGVSTVLATKAVLLPTAHSRIVEPHLIPGLDDDAVFPEAMAALGRELAPRAGRLLLLASNERYAALCIRHREALEPWFGMAFPGPDLTGRLLDKVAFADLCAEHGVPHPRTWVVQRGADPATALPSSYPVVVKPADSAAWFATDFPGKEKVYTVTDAEQFVRVVQSVAASDYPGALVVQEFVPGGTETMYVLNAYVDRRGEVRMAQPGRIVLAEPDPELLGNYCAVLPEEHEDLVRTCTALLTATGYHGYANIDVKVDPRTGTPQVLEVNVRQGRSSFYVTASGRNLMEPIVTDLVPGAPAPERGDVREVLWHSVPTGFVERYVADPVLRERAARAVAQKRTLNTLDYRADRSWRRRLAVLRLKRAQARRFERHASPVG